MVNGSFELGVNPGLNATLLAVDSTTITGWTVLSGSVDYTENRWTAAEGKRCLDMTGVSGGTLVQTITGFTVGRRYRLSFQMAGNPEGGPTVKSMRASIGDAARIYTFNGAGRSGVDMGWEERHLDFTANSSALILAFTGLDSGIYGAALDAVSIGEVPLELSIRCSEVEVCWPTLPNQSYQLQYRSALTTNVWINLLPPMTGTGTNSCILDAVRVGEPQRFYQVIKL